MIKLRTKMPHKLETHYIIELEQYFTLLKQNQLNEAWHHLERAHILGQPYPFQHSQVHWLMLLFGFRIKNYKEIIGQLPRLLVGGIKSFVGHIPKGNTGGANVPALKAMPIPEDLNNILQESY